MRRPRPQTWDLTPREAVARQRRLAPRVVTQDDFTTLQWVAGVDVGFEDKNQTAHAAAVVLSFPDLEPLQAGLARRPVSFPYIPGLLAFREAPVIIDALAQLSLEPDLIVVDGHGLAHPRRFGIASMLGVVLNIPTIGCAKSILVGSADEPQNQVGAWTPLLDGEEVIGAAVRTRLDVRPIYVSVGHRISLTRAINVVLRCTTRYRLPETTRYAHRVAAGQAINLKGVMKER